MRNLFNKSLLIISFVGAAIVLENSILEGPTPSYISWYNLIEVVI